MDLCIDEVNRNGEDVNITAAFWRRPYAFTRRHPGCALALLILISCAFSFPLAILFGASGYFGSMWLVESVSGIAGLVLGLALGFDAGLLIAFITWAILFLSRSQRVASVILTIMPFMIVSVVTIYLRDEVSLRYGCLASIFVLTVLLTLNTSGAMSQE